MLVLGPGGLVVVAGEVRILDSCVRIWGLFIQRVREREREQVGDCEAFNEEWLDTDRRGQCDR